MRDSTFTRRATDDGRRARRRPADRHAAIPRPPARRKSHTAPWLSDPHHACLGAGRHRSGTVRQESRSPAATLAAQPFRAGHRGGHRAVVRPDSTPPTSAPTRHSMPGRSQVAPPSRSSPGRPWAGRHSWSSRTSSPRRICAARPSPTPAWAATTTCFAKLAQGQWFADQHPRRRGRVQSNRPNRSRRSCRSSSPIRSPALSSPRLTTSDGQSRRVKAVAGSREPMTVLVVRQDFLSRASRSGLGTVTWAGRGRRADARRPRRGAAGCQQHDWRRDLGKGLDAGRVDASFQETTFTNDPDIASLNDHCPQIGLGRAAQTVEPRRVVRSSAAQRSVEDGRPKPQVNA